MSSSKWETLGFTAEKSFTKEKLREARPRIKTGFYKLDEVLGGGLDSTSLTILGGVSGLGKSTFALQLAEKAERENPGLHVLYFSLEMSARWITAKAICRQYYIDTKKRLTAVRLTNPELNGGIPNSGWDRLESIRLGLMESCQRFHIVEPAAGVPLTADRIVSEARSFAAKLKQQRQQGEKDDKPLPYPPLVIVDYLQILPPPDKENKKTGSERQNVEGSLGAFVGLSNEMPVILISSLNRISYKRPIQMDSFKESGGIEYSADVLLGLQFRACHKKEEEWDLNAEKGKSPRKVELSVIKQRYGRSGEEIPFLYYPEVDYFQEQSTQEAGQTAVEASANTGDEAGEGEAFYYINNTKIANEIRKGSSGGECVVFSTEDVTTEYRLSQSGRKTKLTAYECNVADAVYTLYHAKQKEFTTDEVLRVLTGDSRQTATKQKRGEVNQAIEKLRSTTIKIDYTKENQRRKRPAGEKEIACVLSGKFLNVNDLGDLQESSNNKYQFPEGPIASIMPLYQYGMWTRQMIKFSSSRLLVCKGDKKMSDTAEHINLKRFLIRRVEVAGYDRDSGSALRDNMRQISFQEGKNLMTELGLIRKGVSTSAWNQKVRRIYKATLTILAYYKETGYIRDYQEKPSKNKKNPVGSIEFKLN